MQRLESRLCLFVISLGPIHSIQPVRWVGLHAEFGTSLVELVLHSANNNKLYYPINLIYRASSQRGFEQNADFTLFSFGLKSPSWYHTSILHTTLPNCLCSGSMLNLDLTIQLLSDFAVTHAKVYASGIQAANFNGHSQAYCIVLEDLTKNQTSKKYA